MLSTHPFTGLHTLAHLLNNKTTLSDDSTAYSSPDKDIQRYDMHQSLEIIEEGDHEDSVVDSGKE